VPGVLTFRTWPNQESLSYRFLHEAWFIPDQQGTGIRRQRAAYNEPRLAAGTVPSLAQQLKRCFDASVAARTVKNYFGRHVALTMEVGGLNKSGGKLRLQSGSVPSEAAWPCPNHFLIAMPTTVSWLFLSASSREACIPAFRSASLSALSPLTIRASLATGKFRSCGSLVAS
jgi:hypothetical protein